MSRQELLERAVRRMAAIAADELTNGATGDAAQAFKDIIAEAAALTPQTTHEAA